MHDLAERRSTRFSQVTASHKPEVMDKQLIALTYHCITGHSAVDQ
nr:hypothetical protein [uncultured Rhodopila sp.]